MTHADLPSASALCLEAFVERMDGDNLMLVCVIEGDIRGLVEFAGLVYQPMEKQLHS